MIYVVDQAAYQRLLAEDAVRVLQNAISTTRYGFAHIKTIWADPKYL